MHASTFDRDELMSHIMSDIAQFVFETHVPWDPFNIELIVAAQKEPKPQDYKCPICGSTEKEHLCD
jgi:hypothetical protein